MNWKRFALAVVAVLILNNIAGFVIHGTLLQADYAQYPNLLRTQEDAANYFHLPQIAAVGVDYSA